MKALPIFVYRNNKFGDCSNGGISSRYEKVLLVHPEGFIEIDENNPPENLVKIVERRLFGNEVYRHVEPVARPKGVGWMAGGCIVDSSDSRFHDVSGGYPLKLHDRCESQEMYDRMFD